MKKGKNKKYKLITGDKAPKANLDMLQKMQMIRQENNSPSQSDSDDDGDGEKQKYKFSKKLSNVKLESIYIGMLLLNPQFIVRYFFLRDEVYFENDELFNIYKSILFTEGGKFSSELAKRGYNFSRTTEYTYKLKQDLKKAVSSQKFNMENIFIDLKKIFVLRKHFETIPIKEIQDKVTEIIEYELYDKMSVEEVENAVVQINDTNKFKSGVLNTGLTEFLKLGENNLTDGLDLPFPTLTEVFKGVRRDETMAFAMPSNTGKSRFSICMATYIALVHRKKVLIISNEMVEDKMKLCLITTILNNKEIQKRHNVDINKTEGELLDFKFRPDDPKKVKVDEKGYVIQEEKESKEDFVNRLSKVSSEFNKVIAVTDWANKEIDNSIYFINITDNTNDELKKVIMNYYYKEKIEYVFYDTLKTDIANIGNGDELKKTATILSNLAQNFGMFIFSTLQLAEGATLPVNLNVNDLAHSRTVKEVLDTLALVKQIHRDTLKDYEYSIKEVDTKFYNLEKFDDPDVRYYSCVIDKNRAGAKPTLLFRLNLAYNIWEELGFLRLKHNENNKED